MKVTDLAAPPELLAAWERDLEELTPVQHAAVQRAAKGIGGELNQKLLALEDPDKVKEFADLLACGVAFHNADMAHEERRLIEDAFRSGEVRILVSTTTLAMGVNRPADVVILAATVPWLHLPPGRPGGDLQRPGEAEWRK